MTGTAARADNTVSRQRTTVPIVATRINRQLHRLRRFSLPAKSYVVPSAHHPALIARVGIELQQKRIPVNQRGMLALIGRDEN